ncbi:hypothetical protein GCM10009646_57030 [Streptomyces aureus]
MLVYPSALDLSTRHLRFLTDRSAAHRVARGTRWRRLSAGRQALLMLAHLLLGHTYAQLAAGFEVGVSTVYRYIAEAVGLLAVRAPDLATAVTAASAKAFVILDGTLLPIDRIAADRPFYSSKHKKHGMNVQVIADPRGKLLWASPALPGAVHDIKAPEPTASSTPSPRRAWPAGRTGLPGRGRHRAGALLWPVGPALGGSTRGERRTRPHPGPRRAGHGNLEDLAPAAETPLQHHPNHQPRPSRPHPPPDLLKLRLAKAQCLRDPAARPGRRPLAFLVRRLRRKQQADAADLRRRCGNHHGGTSFASSRAVAAPTLRAPPVTIAPVETSPHGLLQCASGQSPVRQWAAQTASTK